ncbi:hypothetical protein [Dactylosporangium sp. NPDC005555]|uniref:hypothetical protein n=1 Tax=Dactylosporangium sp. NPDC005555 TaxID=3154889 RepID=UPI0033BC61BE
MTAQLIAMLALPGVLSAAGAADLRALLAAQARHDLAWLPARIPGRQAKAHLLAWLLDEPATAGRAEPYVDTATDVLRVLIVRSGGTGSIADRPRLATVPRPLRRTLLALLDRRPVARTVDDMRRHPRAWVAAGEKLHPATHAARYPNAAHAFATIRGGNPNGRASV